MKLKFRRWTGMSLVLVLLPLVSLAQTPELEWAGGLNSTGIFSISDVVCDSDGNVYVGGQFSGTADFDPGPGTYNVESRGGNDGFAAKYSKEGLLLWVKQYGSAGLEQEAVEGIAVHSDGTKFAIVGNFQNSIDFGNGQVHTSNGSSDAFIVVYDLYGAVIWVQTFGAGSWDYGNRICFYEDDVYVTGMVRGLVDFNPSGSPYKLQTHSESDNHGLFVAKYDENGILHWAGTAGGGEAYSFAFGLAVDQAGNVYVGGRYSDAIDLDFSQITRSLVSHGGPDGYIAKYDSSGSIVWDYSIGSSSPLHEEVWDLTLDDSFLYLTGSFGGTVNFDVKDEAAPPFTSKGGSDAYVAKYTLDGDYVWAKTFGTSNDDFGRGIAVDEAGNVLVAGHYEGSSFSIGEYSLNSSGRDAFWTRLGAEGNVNFAGNLASPSDDRGYGVAVDHTFGGMFITGSYSANLLSSDVDNSVQLPHTSSTDAYIFNFNHSYYNLVQEPTHDCFRNTVLIPIYANQPLAEGVIGLDVCLDYDESVLRPTKRVEYNEIMTGSAGTPKHYIDDHADGTIDVSLYFENGLHTFNGQGRIASVEFEVIAPGGLPDSVLLATSCGVWESHQIGFTERLMTPVDYIYQRDDRGEVIFWDEAGNHLEYDSNNPADYTPTYIIPTNATGTTTGTPITTDVRGKFSLQTPETHIRLARDMPGNYNSTDCTGNHNGTIGGQDVHFTRLVSSRWDDNVPGLKLNPYMFIAMDVNMDGRITAGDAALIGARALYSICEFPQAWNYPSDGSAPTLNSLDWRFVDAHTANSHPSYQMSSQYPGEDGVGYSRTLVPYVPAALDPPTIGDGPCGTKEIRAILLGDVDGTWSDTEHKNVRVVNDIAVLLDVDHAVASLPNAVAQEGYSYVPIRSTGVKQLTSMDFWNIGEAEQYIGTPVMAATLEETYAIAHRMAPFRLISYALQEGIGVEAPVWYLPVRREAIPQLQALLAEAKALVNGRMASIKVGQEVTGIEEAMRHALTLYPNPATHQVMVQHASWAGQQATINIRDMRGRLVLSRDLVLKSQVSLDLATFDRGVYLVEVVSPSQRWHGKFVKE